MKQELESRMETSAGVTLAIHTPGSQQGPIETDAVIVGAGPVGLFQVFELGLTGKDWSGVKIQPVSWRVQLLGDDGKVQASSQSFLWDISGR